MKKFFICAALVLLCLPVCAKENKVAVVISRISYQMDMENVGAAAKAWTAVSSLAGMPYDCFFAEDLKGKFLSGYASVVFTHCMALSDSTFTNVCNQIKLLISADSGVIIDGPLGIYDQNAGPRTVNSLDDFLGITHDTCPAGDGFRIKVSDNRHFAMAGCSNGEYLSHYLTSSMPVQRFQTGSLVLARLSDERNTYPYLSVKKIGGGRIALTGGLSSGAGVGSVFRNQDPKGFFPNKIYPVMEKLLQWSLFGDTQKPFPSLRLSNADMTAIIRLDGDGAHSVPSMKLCMNYLIDIANESGVQSVMSFVSSWATRGGWNHYAQLIKKMEESGSETGTHSRTHLLSELEGDQFYGELDSSQAEIRNGLTKAGFDPGPVEYLINPGNGLAMHQYKEVAERFRFFMTHGLDQSLSVAYGNISWFTGGKRLAVVNDSPSPDYQWFYDNTWSYTTAEAAMYEDAVLNHMYSGIGHGVIFNAMWHDYGMSRYLAAEPRNVTRIVREGSRIINASHENYYNVVRNFFNTHDIYCPGPKELAGKMKLSSTAGFSWEEQDHALVIQIDFDKEVFAEYGLYVGGMSLDINNAPMPVGSVTINGKPHFAFSDKKVILPNTGLARMTVKVTFAPGGAFDSRLVYTSKILDGITCEKGILYARVVNPSLARLRFETKVPSVLLHCDSFVVEESGQTLLGRLTGSGTVAVVATGNNEIQVVSASLPVTAVKNGQEGLELTVKSNGKQKNEIAYRCNGHLSLLSLNAFEGNRKIMLKSGSLLFTAVGLTAQVKDTVRYLPSAEDFINPERGLIHMPGNGTGPLTAEVLEDSRAHNRSMVWLRYNIGKLPDSISNDLDLLRQHGMKAVLNFAYTTDTSVEEAQPEIVLLHMDGLAPLLKEHCDVIALVHYSSNHLAQNENMRQVLLKLLDILPASRFIQVSSFLTKQHVFDRITPLTLEEAFSAKPVARVGHYKECFFAIANPNDSYLAVECQYTPVGGATCNPGNGTQAECQKMLEELERIHCSYLNPTNNGCLDQISRRLGYRLELLEGVYQKTINPGGAFNFSMKLINRGFASPFNPRLVELVMVKKDGGAAYKVMLPEDPRFWFPNEDIVFSYSVGIPSGMPDGQYNLYLHLPDPESRLYGNPLYSIRLANSNVNYTKEGYNELGYSVEVTSRTEDTYRSFLKFEKIDFTR